MNTSANISTCLWFDEQAEEATKFYTSVFKDSKIVNPSYYGEASHDIHGQKAGTVLTVDFELFGQSFQALNGGPHFKFNQSISFYVKCTSEEEIDRLWSQLSDGGKTHMELMEYPFSKKYGWLSDRFGLSWQLILDDEEPDQKILPCLMFVNAQQGNAEEAIHFYLDIFKDSEIIMNAHYQEGQVQTDAKVVHAEFSLEGYKFVAMDSGVHMANDINFNEAISMVINCETQEEIDYYWEKLSADTEAEQCGWVKDRYGLSWQIIPTNLEEMMRGTATEKRERMMEALLKMKKLDIVTLQEAYNGN